MPLDRHGFSTPDADGSQRNGRVFTLRLAPTEEEALRALMVEHEKQTQWWDRYGSNKRGGLGAFMIWAALQYKPPARKAKASK